MKNACPRCQSKRVFWLKEVNPINGLDQLMRAYGRMNCCLTYWRHLKDSQGNLVTQATLAKFVRA